MSKEYDFLFKILIIGDSGCGKSCLLVRFADNSFGSSYITTIGVDFKVKTVDVDGKRVKLQIWDTAGQERFRTITSTYYRGANGIMIVFDTTSVESFDGVVRWNHEIANNLDGVPIILVGNKIDLQDERKVDKQKAEDFSRSCNIQYFETSAKENTNVSETFLALTRFCIDAKLKSNESGTKANDQNKVNLSDFSKKKKCC